MPKKDGFQGDGGRASRENLPGGRRRKHERMRGHKISPRGRGKSNFHFYVWSNLK